MKKLLMAAAAASALAAAPALAATTADYAVTGSVAAVCSVTATGTVAFGALTSGTGAYTNSGTSTEATDSSAYCNQAATTVEITHTNLSTTTTGTIPSTFTNTVVITPVVTTDGPTLTGDKAAGTAIGAFSLLKVKATAATPSLKLIAGAYTGSITITLSPAS